MDLGDSAHQVIREGLRIASGDDTEITLVHVVHELSELLGNYVCNVPLPQMQSDLTIEGKAKLHRLAQEYFADRPARELLLSGVPWNEIVGAALRHGADTIVIGAHTIDQPKHRLVGSTASRVVRHAPCSVLVVQPE